MSETTLNERYEQARKTLEAAGQSHLLQDWAELNEAQRETLLGQISDVDWPELTRLIETHVRNKPEFSLPETGVEPAPWYSNIPTPDQEAGYVEARQIGEQLVADGKVAAFTVAGGQGTRLGWDGPKGTFPATPIRQLTLFGCFAEYIRHMQAKHDAIIPWYVMTSPINDKATRAFFESQNYFQLDPANVMIFPQQMMPSVDMQTGKVLLAEKGKIALNPNGHGGSLKALYTSGAIADMQKRGITQISYVQVDNPIVRIIDPLFLGLHERDGAQMSSKMLPKRDPFEKLGNFCLIDGKMTVIEYSDLPDELAVQRDDSGQLRFLAGSIAIHAIRVDFVEALNTKPEGFGLPYHRADKKVPYLNTENGQIVEPGEPNAVKLETFVFDALPMTDASIIYETSRPDEFAPIKNASGDGVLDSPETSKVIQMERASRWLEANGVAIPRNADGSLNCTLEISQFTAIEAEDLKLVELPQAVDAGQSFLL